MAKDTIILYETSQDHFTYLCLLLLWCEAVLGLKINLEMSELVPRGSITNVEILVEELGARWVATFYTMVLALKSSL